MKEPTERNGSGVAGSGDLLRVENLTVRFGGLTAVDSVSFEVPKGELLGVIGPNGAGKTTVFNAVAGAIKPTGGSITFDGRRIEGRTPNRVAQLGVGRTFQTVRLFKSLTVVENVLVAASTKTRSSRLARENALEAADMVGLGGVADRRAGEVPLADQKRTEIARALATDPRLLLLDEMMSGLNPEETEAITSLVLRLNAEGLTIIAVEHVMEVINRLCRHVVVLNNGRLIAEGTPRQVLEEPGVVEAYLGRGRDAAEGG